MKPAQLCGACGATYSPEFVRAWGRSSQTDGYGPRPVCTQLVPGFGPPTPSGERPMQWCGAQLSSAQVANDVHLIEPAPIELKSDAIGSQVLAQIAALTARIRELEGALPE